jgi:hypothetical protein
MLVINGFSGMGDRFDLITPHPSNNRRNNSRGATQLKKSDKYQSQVGFENKDFVTNNMRQLDLLITKRN